MKIPNMNRPRGYSGIARGIPRTITIVTKLNSKSFSIVRPIGLVILLQVALVDVLVIWKEESVETALNPATWVFEVDVATVVVEEDVNVKSAGQACIGPSDLALGIVGIAKAKTIAKSTAYFTQAVPSFIKRTRR